MIQPEKLDVVGIGISPLDMIHVVDHFPSDEEVQESLDSAVSGGGPVATAIVTLARLGAKTLMFDRIGDDWRGKLILDAFKREQVNTAFIKIDKGKSSTAASILVRKSDGARTIVCSRGSAEKLSIEDFDLNMIKLAKYIHLNGRHFPACVEICRFAKKNDVKVSFDGGSSRYRHELKEIVPLSDVCIITREFAEKYTGEPDMDHAARQLLKIGPEIIVITDGLAGSWLYTNSIQGYHQPAYIMDNIIDTTGCGDSYHGAFLFGLINDYSLYNTISFASAVAALNTQALGGRDALPTLEEAKTFFEQREN